MTDTVFPTRALQGIFMADKK